MTLETSVANETNAMPAGPDCLIQQRVHPPSELADILFEQLDYLIQFADQEHGRLERVKAVLMEPFQ
jgi:hypothetical protein